MPFPKKSKNIPPLQWKKKGFPGCIIVESKVWYVITQIELYASQKSHQLLLDWTGNPHKSFTDFHKGEKETKLGEFIINSWSITFDFYCVTKRKKNICINFCKLASYIILVYGYKTCTKVSLCEWINRLFLALDKLETLREYLFSNIQFHQS